MFVVSLYPPIMFFSSFKYLGPRAPDLVGCVEA